MNERDQKESERVREGAIKVLESDIAKKLRKQERERERGRGKRQRACKGEKFNKQSCSS